MPDQEYENLYNKHRPPEFSELVGQDHIVRDLESYLKYKILVKNPPKE